MDWVISFLAVFNSWSIVKLSHVAQPLWPPIALVSMCPSSVREASVISHQGALSSTPSMTPPNNQFNRKVGTESRPVDCNSHPHMKLTIITLALPLAINYFHFLHLIVYFPTTFFTSGEDNSIIHWQISTQVYMIRNMNNPWANQVSVTL